MKRVLPTLLAALLCILPLAAWASEAPSGAWDGRFYNLLALNLSIEVAAGAEILSEEDIRAIPKNEAYRTSPTLLAQAIEPDGMRLMITMEPYADESDAASQTYADLIQADIAAQLGDTVTISDTSRIPLAESMSVHFSVSSSEAAQDYYVLSADGYIYVVTFRYEMSLSEWAKDEVMMRFLQI